MTPRAAFVASKDIKKIAKVSWDALMMASSHDPDHEDRLKKLEERLAIAERQLERMGAPQYRKIRV